jgi:hypothetical protein
MVGITFVHISVAYAKIFTNLNSIAIYKLPLLLHQCDVSTARVVFYESHNSDVSQPYIKRRIRQHQRKDRLIKHESHNNEIASRRHMKMPRMQMFRPEI